MRAGLAPADTPSRTAKRTGRTVRDVVLGVAIKPGNNTTAILRVGTVPLFTQPSAKRSGKRARDADRAIRHNRRMYQPAKADATRKHLNYALAGPVMAKDVHPAALAMLKAMGITPRINASIIELIFTIPPNFAMEEKAFFAWCLTFSQAQFGAQNIITADVHRDQEQPHMHALIMPISGGKLRATTLLGSRIGRVIDGKKFKGYEIQVTFAAALKDWIDAAKKARENTAKHHNPYYLCVVLLVCGASRSALALPK